MGKADISQSTLCGGGKKGDITRKAQWFGQKERIGTVKVKIIRVGLKS